MAANLGFMLDHLEAIKSGSDKIIFAFKNNHDAFGKNGLKGDRSFFREIN